ncbi:MAG: hypothetical protein Q8Q73_12625 [Stagnimonas sp.]|nr:hypothetical protein [Stagnimonas sp.]
MKLGGRQRLLAGFALGWVAATTAAANELDGRSFHLGGFGTLGAVYHEDEGLRYRRSVSQPAEAEAGELDFSTDSRLGLQLNASWNPQLEAVVQAVSKLTEHGDWQPQLTRGFLRYRPNESLMLRAGRLGYELFPRADSIDIGYSYPNIRPPVEVFGQIPADYSDGLDLTYTRPVGPGLINLKLYGGQTSGAFVGTDGAVRDLSDSKIWGTSLDYLQGAWQGRIGGGIYMVNEPTRVPALSQGLRQTGDPQAQALADEFDGAGRRIGFLVAGLSYDEGPLQARLFLGRLQPDSLTGPSLNIGSLIASYNLGVLTPYLGVAASHSYSEIQPTGLPDSNPQYVALNQASVRAQSSFRNDQTSLTGGLRYDFARNLALKFQIDHLWLRGSNLVVDDNQPPLDDPEMTVFGLALDFIF